MYTCVYIQMNIQTYNYIYIYIYLDIYIYRYMLGYVKICIGVEGTGVRVWGRIIGI